VIRFLATPDAFAWSDVLKLAGAVVGAILGQSFMQWRKERKEEREGASATASLTERVDGMEITMQKLCNAFASHTGITINGIDYRKKEK
jgi:hypothetical protein